MSDRYNIDGHKLNYHPARVGRWLDGELTYPVYMEVSPAGACNHRCVFCGLDFMEYKPRYLETGMFKERLTEMGRLGLKSIMFAGEGEPFLHKDMVEIAQHTKASGIDVAFTTNGVLMKPAVSEAILGSVEWIKVSCNGGTGETYAKLHGTQAEDFDRVLGNLEQAVKTRQRMGGGSTLGLQALLLPDNEGEMLSLAKTVRDIGLDYFVVKPYSQHPQGKSREYESINYGKYDELAASLEALASADFSVIFRKESMKHWDRGDKGYGRCYGLPFWSYIDAGGNVWGCSVYLGDERFNYGNIYEQSFQSIWEGEKRRESLRWVESELDPADCRVNCRMDSVNRFLWSLRNPPEHVNFI